MYFTAARAVRRGSSQPQWRPVLGAVPRRVWLASLLLAGLLVAPSPADAARLGSKTVGSKVERNGAGQAQDYRLRAAAGGEVSRLSVYLDRASTASSVELGVYSGTNATAKSLLARCVIKAPKAAAW